MEIKSKKAIEEAKRRRVAKFTDRYTKIHVRTVHGTQVEHRTNNSVTSLNRAPQLHKNNSVSNKVNEAYRSYRMQINTSNSSINNSDNNYKQFAASLINNVTTKANINTDTLENYKSTSYTVENKDINNYNSYNSQLNNLQISNKSETLDINNKVAAVEGSDLNKTPVADTWSIEKNDFNKTPVANTSSIGNNDFNKQPYDNYTGIGFKSSGVKITAYGEEASNAYKRILESTEQYTKVSVRNTNTYRMNHRLSQRPNGSVTIKTGTVRTRHKLNELYKQHRAKRREDDELKINQVTRQSSNKLSNEQSKDILTSQGLSTNKSVQINNSEQQNKLVTADNRLKTKDESREFEKANVLTKKKLPYTLEKNISKDSWKVNLGAESIEINISRQPINAHSGFVPFNGKYIDKNKGLSKNVILNPSKITEINHPVEMIVNLIKQFNNDPNLQRSNLGKENRPNATQSYEDFKRKLLEQEDDSDNKYQLLHQVEKFTSLDTTSLIGSNNIERVLSELEKLQRSQQRKKKVRRINRSNNAFVGINQTFTDGIIRGESKGKPNILGLGKSKSKKQGIAVGKAKVDIRKTAQDNEKDDDKNIIERIIDKDINSVNRININGLDIEDIMAQEGDIASLNQSIINRNTSTINKSYISNGTFGEEMNNDLDAAVDMEDMLSDNISTDVMPMNTSISTKGMNLPMTKMTINTSVLGSGILGMTGWNPLKMMGQKFASDNFKKKKNKPATVSEKVEEITEQGGSKFIDGLGNLFKKGIVPIIAAAVVLIATNSGVNGASSMVGAIFSGYFDEVDVDGKTTQVSIAELMADPDRGVPKLRQDLIDKLYAEAKVKEREKRVIELPPPAPPPYVDENTGEIVYPPAPTVTPPPNTAEYDVVRLDVLGMERPYRVSKELLDQQLYSTENMIGIMQPIFNIIAFKDHELKLTKEQEDQIINEIFNELFEVKFEYYRKEYCGQSLDDGQGDKLICVSCGDTHALKDTCPYYEYLDHGSTYTCDLCDTWDCPGHSESYSYEVTNPDGSTSTKTGTRTTYCNPGCIGICDKTNTQCLGHDIGVMKVSMDGLPKLLDKYFYSVLDELDEEDTEDGSNSKKRQELLDNLEICEEMINQIDYFDVDLDKVAWVTGSRADDVEVRNKAYSQRNSRGDKYWQNMGYTKRLRWDGCFVSWCLSEYGVAFTTLKQGQDLFQSAGAYVSRDFEDIAGGDVIFIDYTGDGEPNRVGVVLGRDSDYVYTVEGNVGDVVKMRHYSLDNEMIVGYGLINY